MEFRVWLRRCVGADLKILDNDSLMDQLSYAAAGLKFSRDEMNERQVLPRLQYLCLYS